MKGRVLGLISAEVPGHPGVSGATKAAALFGLLVTSPGFQCTKEEVAACLWPGEERPDDRLYRVVSDLRYRLGEEIVPRNPSGVCAIRPPEGSVDYVRFREGVERAERLWGREQGPGECLDRLV
ncbi:MULTISPECIES: AfsR/SARP family transcriptional regulator [unclassified Streptomyces]|uniref:AfsR/SARP family transcriptional regulator n=1 Tax=unclassified Streptomyces TaxID=2593676 RepID=UPI002E2C9CA2|nr:hypothetical protein [Streptomyces sp. NBC_00223]